MCTWITNHRFYFWFSFVKWYCWRSCVFVCRDVIKWLFSAIIKSTEHGESRERDEQIRWITQKTCFWLWTGNNKKVALLMFICMLYIVTNFFLSPAEWCPSSRGCCPWLWRWTAVQLWPLPSCPRSSSICSSAAYLYVRRGEEQIWEGRHTTAWREP